MQQKSSCAIHKQPYTSIDVGNKMLLCSKCEINRSNSRSQIMKIAEFFQQQHHQNSQNQKICRNVLVQCLLQQLKHFQIINISLDAIKELDKVKLKSKETNLKSIQLFDIHELTTQNIQKFFNATKIQGLKQNLEDVQKIYDQKVSYEIENMNIFSQILLDSMDDQPPQADKVEQLKNNIMQNKCSSQLAQIFSDFYRRIYDYEIILQSPQKIQSSCDTIVFKQALELQFQIQDFQDNLLHELQEQHQLLNQSIALSEHMAPIAFTEDISVPGSDRLQMSQIMVEKELEDLQVETNQDQSKQDAYKLAQECVQNFMEGNYINAMIKINLALELNQENSQYFYLQSMCFIKQENFSEAIQAIEKAIDIQKIPYYFYIKGKILSYQGFKKTALQQLQVCQKINDQIEGCYLLKAQIYEQFGEKNQALINYQQVLRVNPYNQLAHLGIQELQQ